MTAPYRVKLYKQQATDEQQENEIRRWLRENAIHDEQRQGLSLKIKDRERMRLRTPKGERDV